MQPDDDIVLLDEPTLTDDIVELTEAPAPPATPPATGLGGPVREVRTASTPMDRHRSTRAFSLRRPLLRCILLMRSP